MCSRVFTSGYYTEFTRCLCVLASVESFSEPRIISSNVQAGAKPPIGTARLHHIEQPWCDRRMQRGGCRERNRICHRLPNIRSTKAYCSNFIVSTKFSLLHLLIDIFGEAWIDISLFLPDYLRLAIRCRQCNLGVVGGDGKSNNKWLKQGTLYLSRSAHTHRIDINDFWYVCFYRMISSENIWRQNWFLCTCVLCLVTAQQKRHLATVVRRHHGMCKSTKHTVNGDTPFRAISPLCGSDITNVCGIYTLPNTLDTWMLYSLWIAFFSLCDVRIGIAERQIEKWMCQCVMRWC